MAQTDDIRGERELPIEVGASTGELAINLILKLLANLRRIDKLDDAELTTVAASLIAELDSDHDRFAAWRLLETLVPDYEGPKER